MIIDATKISYFKDPERSAFDQLRKKKPKVNREKNLGVIIDASVEANKRRKKEI